MRAHILRQAMHHAHPAWFAVPVAWAAAAVVAVAWLGSEQAEVEAAPASLSAAAALPASAVLAASSASEAKYEPDPCPVTAAETPEATGSTEHIQAF